MPPRPCTQHLSTVRVRGLCAAAQVAAGSCCPQPCATPAPGTHFHPFWLGEQELSSHTVLCDSEQDLQVRAERFPSSFGLLKS